MKYLFSFIFFGLASIQLFGQSNVFGDWTYNVDEYTNKKSITTNAFKDAETYVAARVMFKSWADGTSTWELMEARDNYRKLSTEQINSISVATIYVKINGVNQEFILPYGDVNYITPELKAALLKGTDGAIKFPGIPYYYKFSLKGISAAFQILEKK